MWVHCPLKATLALEIRFPHWLNVTITWNWWSRAHGLIDGAHDNHGELEAPQACGRQTQFAVTFATASLQDKHGESELVVNAQRGKKENVTTFVCLVSHAVIAWVQFALSIANSLTGDLLPTFTERLQTEWNFNASCSLSLWFECSLRLSLFFVCFFGLCNLCEENSKYIPLI